MPASSFLPEEQATLDNMKEKVLQRQGDVEQSEDDLYAEAAPTGTFHKKQINALVDAVNQLVPLFGITEKYDKFTEDITTFPVEFVRLLSMFVKAISDAIEEGVLTEDAAISLDGIIDDASVLTLAGRIIMASKNASFKRWLKKPRTVKPEAEQEQAEKTPPQDIDTLFAERM